MVSSGVAALKNGEAWVLEPESKATLLERTFASKCNLPLSETNEYSAVGYAHFMEGFLRIRFRDVLRVLKELRPDSATGPDHIATYVLKTCASVLALPLGLLAKRILETQRWPQLWMAHWIAALHKKKFVFDAANYLGVHITSQVNKVIERVLGIQLFPVMIERAFGESQYAYRPKRGARDAVLLYVATYLKKINDGMKI